MSTKIASKKTVVECLTANFESDVKKFFVWAVEKEYIIKANADDGKEIEWSLDLLKSIIFKEPGRNKLECLIKAVMDTYAIYREKTRMDDAKLIAKDFKETPVEKSPSKNAKKAESSEAPAVV